MRKTKKYQTFAEFYPFYLSQHQNKVCRTLHYIGSAIAFCCILFGIITGAYTFIGLAILVGYAFAWIGHYFFEKNRPATFTYPFYSFLGDWVMFVDAFLLYFFKYQRK